MFDEFGHRCWYHFGIPLASNSMFFRDRFSKYFGDVFISIFHKTWLVDLGVQAPPFRHFFDPVPKVMFFKVPWLTSAAFLLLLAPCWSFSWLAAAFLSKVFSGL